MNNCINRLQVGALPVELKQLWQCICDGGGPRILKRLLPCPQHLVGTKHALHWADRNWGARWGDLMTRSDFVPGQTVMDLDFLTRGAHVLVGVQAISKSMPLAAFIYSAWQPDSRVARVAAVLAGDILTGTAAHLEQADACPYAWQAPASEPFDGRDWHVPDTVRCLERAALDALPTLERLAWLPPGPSSTPDMVANA